MHMLSLRLGVLVCCALIAIEPVKAADNEPFPSTSPLTMTGDITSELVAGADRFLLRQTEEALKQRERFWKRDYSSTEKYEASLAPNRERLSKILGVVDPRIPYEAPEFVGNLKHTSLVGEGSNYEIHAIRWPVLRGVDGEGLLLRPKKGKPVADVIALPDADQTPEMLVGLVPGVPQQSQFARRLAENNCRVFVPLLIDRRDTYSKLVGRGPTNQPHREWIYRQAFEMGRHIIGYEIQKILALVDWLARDTPKPTRKIGVAGYGEGGLLALYSGALDRRIDCVLCSGYFDSRQQLWQEPIYRNVFGLHEQFGDAELASMIAPRSVVIEASRAPQIDGPPRPREGHSGGAAPGRIRTATLEAVRAEFERIGNLAKEMANRHSLMLFETMNGEGDYGDRRSLQLFLGALQGGQGVLPEDAGFLPRNLQVERDLEAVFRRQFDQLVENTQALMRESEYTRRVFWAKADRKSRTVDAWQKSSEWYRKYFAEEVIGKFDQPLLPPNPRSRKVYDEPTYTGYEVVLDVWPDVIAYGLLLMPKDIRPGEKRPVVVCQHGLEGRPQDVANPRNENPAYHRYACKLAERGFITFAPQNLYIFTDRFRSLQRKLNPLKKTLFSIIVPQHQQIVDWLASLPMVDPERIAFYGLSYGGKTAMRVPPLVSRYCLSICSADFNEWIWKNTSVRSPYSYVGTGEYEIFEFDLGNTFNYAEMAGLIAPRPFMVERGHRDGVAPDEWVAYEFAKVRLLYADLKIEDRAVLEVFEGPHTIHGVGTFDFLHQHLRWPKK